LAPSLPPWFTQASFVSPGSRRWPSRVGAPRHLPAESRELPDNERVKVVCVRHMAKLQETGA